MERHCHHCGAVYSGTGQPGRSATCSGCGADLHVCLNCVSYDPGVADQCREQQAEPELQKDRANYCEFFQMAQRAPGLRAGAKTGDDAAREKLRKLFGD